MQPPLTFRTVKRLTYPRAQYRRRRCRRRSPCHKSLDTGTGNLKTGSRREIKRPYCPRVGLRGCGRENGTREEKNNKLLRNY